MAWEGSPTVVTERRLYSEALTNRISRFKLTVKPKKPLPPESIKELLKAKINPSKIKVGINTLRTLRNGQVLIETSSRKELEVLENDINEKCGEKLEVSAHKLRSPRVVILNTPEEISVENVEDIIIAQNPNMNLKQGEINAKFSYQTKKHVRNLVIKVEAGTRKLLLQKKIKLGWQICTVHD
jgi:predicted DNA-binding protein